MNCGKIVIHSAYLSNCRNIMLNKNNFLKLLENITILYIEDEDMLREDIKDILLVFCKNILTAKDGEEGYEIYKKEKPQFILTDINIPKIDGISLSKKIREDDITTAIAFLTAYSDEEKLLLAANLNIQGYILKSTLTYEKIKDLLFKAIIFLDLSTNLYLNINDELSYEQTLGQFTYKNDLKINLNKKEKALMNLLLQNKNKLVTYRQIENNVWDNYDEVMSGTALRTIVKSLRKKIPTPLIKNISGEGYKLTLFE